MAQRRVWLLRQSGRHLTKRPPFATACGLPSKGQQVGKAAHGNPSHCDRDGAPYSAAQPAASEPVCTVSAAARA